MLTLQLATGLFDGMKFVLIKFEDFGFADGPAIVYPAIYLCLANNSSTTSDILFLNFSGCWLTTILEYLG